jgi:hypothetical protein
MLQRNGFKGGMNKDADSSVMPPDFYLDAHNLTLTGDGKFFALENIKGTTELGVLDISFFGEVMAVYENRYTIGTDTDVRCLTVFTAESGGNFQIWCYRLDTSDVKKLFAQSFDADFEAANPEVDAVVYPEGGIDIIYFTDNYNELRKLRCEIPTGAADNFLKESDLSLQRRATLMNTSYNVASSGGALESGSYQFTFRFFNEDTGAYTRWTIPSHPINVSGDTSGEGYYGLNSSKKIDVTLSVVDSELDFWTHFQVGVIENTTSVVQTVAALQKLEAMTGGSVITPGYTDFTYSYKSNGRIADLLLADVVVDLAAIERAKTIQIKNNRLFVGNVRYANLEYDRVPTLSSGSIVAQPASMSDDNNSSSYRGYFRGEVYRLYLTYWDENYNLSRPIHFDLTSVTNNTLTNGDVKFPARNGTFSLMDNTSVPQQLGMNLTITNHPSWARGFAVFRAKRKKNKLFQTPLIPGVEIAGMDALGEYPNIATELDAAGTGVISTDYPDATPMNPLGTVVPKNLFHTVAQNIVQSKVDDIPSNNQRGECSWYTPDFYNGHARNFGFIFEPFAQYGLSDPYTPTTSDKLRVVDMAFLKLDYTNFGSSSYLAGDYLETSVHGTFYAAANTDYWKQWGTSPSYPSVPLMPETVSVAGFIPLDNVGEGSSLGGSDVCRFSNLQTQGISLYPTPSNQRMGVIQHSGMADPSYYSNTFLAAKVNASFFKVGGLAGAAGSVVNNFVTTLAGFVENSSYVGSVAIVDIESTLGDDRYGDSDTIHDMIFTGASHTFKDSDLATVASSGAVAISLSVFGGDCYVSTHNFKISDNHFSLINQQKSVGTLSAASSIINGQAPRWKRIFKNKYGWASCMPTGLKTVSQVLSVVLESEVNGEILAKRPYTSAVGKATTTTSEGQARIPFTYLYNRGFTQSSDQKALVPQLDTEQIVTDYRARVLYSDQKVYNSDIQGFDVFRVSNFTDLDESSYSLTKLTLDGDNLVAIQEQGIAVIPVDASLLSTTDGATISVRSGTTDLPVYLSRIYGSQHLKSVIRSGDAVFFVDNRNQRVFRLGGGQLDILSDKGMVKQFNADLASTVAQVRGLWDNNRAHYWVFNEDFCYLWDDRLKVWVSSHDVSPDDGVYTSDGLLTISHFDDRLAVHKMYDGEYNSFYTQTVTPKVSIVVNAEYENNKVFDTVIAYSNGKLDSLDVITSRENGAFGGESLGTTFAYNRREGYYTVPTLRDIHGARMRGTYAEVTLYWPTDNEKITLSQVVTAYRPSPRLPQ